MGRLLKLKTPPLPLLVEEEVPRSVSLAVMVAPSNTAPAESCTVPVMLAVICCANVRWLRLQSPRTITRATPHKEIRLILASKTKQFLTGPYWQERLATLLQAALSPEDLLQFLYYIRSPQCNASRIIEEKTFF